MFVESFGKRAETWVGTSGKCSRKRAEAEISPSTSFRDFPFCAGAFSLFLHRQKNSMNPSRVRISRELKPAGIQALLTKLEGYEEKLQASQP